MTPTELLLAALIGLSAGVLGGLAGIGGSMIILPGLALIFGFHTPDFAEQHMYMAAAMATNVLVALPATRRHMHARAVRRDLIARILPAMLVAMVLGVLLSNIVTGVWLKRLLAIFIFAYALVNLYRLLRPLGSENRPVERVGRRLLMFIGGTAGLFGGLLGLGGGVVMVPLLQVIARVRLREAIAVSSAVMIATALVGAAIKFFTLPQHNLPISFPALLVVMMAPTAIAGAWAGAYLAHRMPLAVIRAIVSILLIIAAVRMVAIS